MNLSFCALAALFLSWNVQASPSGPSVSGGTPPAPRAVVVQAHAVSGQFDEQGRAAALSLAAQHMAQDRLLAATQRASLQSATRTYLCLEYRSYSDFNLATDEFKQVLAQFPSMEVVNNGGCP